MSKHVGCYPGCYYYSDSCFRKDCPQEQIKQAELENCRKVEKESLLDKRFAPYSDADSM